MEMDCRLAVELTPVSRHRRCLQAGIQKNRISLNVPHTCFVEGTNCVLCLIALHHL